MPYLFTVSLGPVQSFIAAARKSSDLKYGSDLLSRLAQAGARAIADKYGEQSLVFPASAVAAANAPNKIVAVVSDPPEKVGQMVEDAIRQALDAERNSVFKTLKNPPNLDEALAARQIDDMLEIYWVGVVFDGTDEGYDAARQQAEWLLSARKATRDFQQAEGDHRPKSSLDGARESVIDEKAYPDRKDDDATKLDKAQKLFQRFGARPAERLSGVDLLKRLGGRGSAFPSTSDMAAKPFLRYVDQHGEAGDSQAMLKEIGAMLQNEGIEFDKPDGSLLYPSRLTEWIPSASKRQNVTRQMEAILQKYVGSKQRPQPYYALLVADGDSMGEIIDNQHGVEKHRALSAKLDQFATEAAIIVKKHEGALIYAGGDDVMAYLPLHTALACAEDLADTFEAMMADFASTEGRTPTLSAGIALVHHLTPLSDALNKARMAEKAAKGVPGKQALAITSSKRSGSDRTIQADRKTLTERLNTMIQWRKKKVISAGVPYELQETFLLLAEADLPKEALTAEALRIIERKREEGGGEMPKGQKESIRQQFETWFKDDSLTLQEIALEMIIAGQIAAIDD